MDYSQLSDFEINRMVGDVIFKGLWACKPETSGNDTSKWYYGNADATLEPLNPLPDYCNDWAASGPIIGDNKIKIEPVRRVRNCNEWYEEWDASVNSPHFCESHKNPLRAAMIVFLLSQDDKHA
ncbi:TPA: phage protein NinX family protein [Enterobacter hormaechei subsp. xiangfangensis]